MDSGPNASRCPGMTAERPPGRAAPVDLRGVDGIAAVGGADAALDLDLVAGHRDLGGGRHVAAIAHLLGEAAEDALRRRLAPTDALGDRVEHAEMLGMVRHQLT